MSDQIDLKGKLKTLELTDIILIKIGAQRYFFCAAQFRQNAPRIMAEMHQTYFTMAATPTFLCIRDVRLRRQKRALPRHLCELLRNGTVAMILKTDG
jgi:hypothetical protein